MRSRTLLVSGIVVALLLAGIGSFYASSHPDGLERVADGLGFGGTARDSSVAEGPLAGYETRGVDDGRLSGGLAGVAGALVVLVLVGGLALLLRRRPSGPSGASGLSGPSGGAEGHPGQGGDRPDQADRPDHADEGRGRV